MEDILLNKIKCLNCGTELVSDNLHDFKFCKCQKVAIDGGNSYLRRVGSQHLIQDLSITVENETDFYFQLPNIYTEILWGVRRGNTVKYKKLIDLETDHLYNILKTQHQISFYMKSVILFILGQRTVSETLKEK